MGEGLLQIGGEWYDPEGIEGPLPPDSWYNVPPQYQQQSVDPAVLELQDLKAQGRMMPGLLRANPYALGSELAGLISPGGSTYDHTLDEDWRGMREKSPANKDRYMTWDFKENRPGREYSKANKFLVDPELRSLDRMMEEEPNLPAGAKREFTERIDKAKRSPLVLYHGTPKAWTDNEIQKNRLQGRDYGWYGSGFYMSPDPELAERYARDKRVDEPTKEGNILPLFSNLQNPFDFNNVGDKDLDRIDQVLKFYGHKGIGEETRKTIKRSNVLGGDAVVQQHLENWSSFLPGGEQGGGGISGMGEKGDISTLLKLAGYDSAIGDGGNEVIIYEPNQAKSIFNQGTWNPLTEDLHTNLGSYLDASSTT